MIKDNKGTFWSIMALFFMQICNGAVTPAIASFMQAFPNSSVTSIYMITTLPTLIVMVLSELVAPMIGKKLPYRTTAILAFVLMLVGGVAPYFANTLSFVLICRAVFAVGVGLIFSMGGALSVLVFPQESSRVMGYGQISMNIGSIICMMLGGILCVYGWNYTFLTYLLVLIPLFCVVFLFKEPQIQYQVPEAKEEKGGNEKFTSEYYLLCLAYLVTTVVIYCIFLNLSSIVVEENIGNASFSGMLLSLSSVAGMVAGAVFSKVYTFSGKYSLALGGLFSVLTCACLYYGNNAAMIILGSIFSGCFMTFMMCAMQMRLQEILTPGIMQKGTAIMMSLFSLGGFLSTYYASLTGKVRPEEASRYPFFIGIFICGAVTILLLIAAVATKSRRLPES
ncbi:MAG: MFS transporter [Lachnospiraceae bacterium]|nr:MFS transporter [Lachnospiraceae bacterium]